MFLLLAGSTEMARALIVDEFLGDHSDWRHLALEDITDAEMDMGEVEEDDIFGFQMAFMTMVACECAKVETAAGRHVIITCPDSDMLPGIYSEIEEEIISVFLGGHSDADGFDHVIDSTTQSMVEISKKLDHIIQAQPA
jgi:hypothetical protein